ncbi:MAG: hypothetical protein H6658_07585 [Ardenticatenaceae bacterium]|nr:hypothetical protein [Ardenticatenaceae bacterium]
MKIRFSFYSLFFILVLGLLVGTTHPPTAEATTTPTLSPAGFLNADGSLDLDGQFSGSLDLSGYDVRLDSQRGPVFTAVQPNQLTGSWDSLGGGGNAINEEVFAILVNGTDVYVGGFFENVDSIPEADRVAKWDGSHWSALGDNGAGEGALHTTFPFTIVTALAIDSSGNLYVGGSFSSVNNYGNILGAADNIAKWDGSNWMSLGSNGAGDGSIQGIIYALAVNGSTVYAGGGFHQVNDNGTVLTAANYIAQWDGSHWSALGGTDTNGSSLNQVVSSLAVSGNDLYVGGSFTNVQDGATVLTKADYIAKWDGSHWSALGGSSANDGALNASVYGLAADGNGNIYAAGAFTNVRQGIFTLTTADYVAKWNGTGWSALGNNGAGDGSFSFPVKRIAANSTGELFVSGDLGDINNHGTILEAARYIAHWDGSDWANLGSDGAGNSPVKVTTGIGTLAVHDDHLYIGGGFAYVYNDVTLVGKTANFAQWDHTSWSAVGGRNNGSLSGSVDALLVDGTDVYVGGSFTNVTDEDTVLTAADYIAKWDGHHWSALGSSVAGNGALNSSVFALAKQGNDLYVGGAFLDVNDNGTTLTAADYIARWDGSHWFALGDNGNGEGSLNNHVVALAVIGNTVYAGGAFADVNNHGVLLTTADYIAQWDGTDWSRLGHNGAGNGSLNGTVWSLATAGSTLYVGGAFTNVQEIGNVLTEADYVAQWDGSHWSALGDNGNSDGSLNCPTSALTFSAPYLYVGGCFTDVNNHGTVLPTADRLARWDGTNWSALGSNGNNDGVIPDFVETIAVDGENIFVGGYFSYINKNGVDLAEAAHLAHWDGTEWFPLSGNGAGGGSLSCNVWSLAVDEAHNLYTGGCFKDVNDNGTILPEADSLAVYRYGSTLQTIYLPFITKD